MLTHGFSNVAELGNDRSSFFGGESPTPSLAGNHICVSAIWCWGRTRGVLKRKVGVRLFGLIFRKDLSPGGNEYFQAQTFWLNFWQPMSWQSNLSRKNNWKDTHECLLFLLFSFYVFCCVEDVSHKLVSCGALLKRNLNAVFIAGTQD